MNRKRTANLINMAHMACERGSCRVG